VFSRISYFCVITVISGYFDLVFCSLICVLSAFNKRTCHVVYVESVAAAPMRHPSGGDPASNNLPSRHSSSSLLSASLMSRSRSSQSLRGPSHDVATTAGATDDDARLTVLVQMFWISVSLLESDFEYEFLLAVRLLDKVSHAMSCCLRRLKYKKKILLLSCIITTNQPPLAGTSS